MLASVWPSRGRDGGVQDQRRITLGFARTKLFTVNPPKPVFSLQSGGTKDYCAIPPLVTNRRRKRVGVEPTKSRWRPLPDLKSGRLTGERFSSLVTRAATILREGGLDQGEETARAFADEDA